MKINGITVTPKKIEKVSQSPFISEADKPFKYNPKWFIGHELVKVNSNPDDMKESDRFVDCGVYKSRIGSNDDDFDDYKFVRIGTTKSYAVYMSNFSNGYLIAYSVYDKIISMVEFVPLSVQNPFAGIKFTGINENLGAALFVFLGIPYGGAMYHALDSNHRGELCIVTDINSHMHIMLFGTNRYLENKCYSDFTHVNLGYGCGTHNVRTKYSNCKKPIIMIDQSIILQIDENAETSIIKDPNRHYNIDHKNNGNWLTSFSYANPDEVVDTYNAFTSGRASRDIADFVPFSGDKHEAALFSLKNASKASGTYLLRYGDNSDSVLYYSLDDNEYPVEKELV